MYIYAMAYKTFLPAGGHNSIRNIKLNTTQFGAVSLLYKANEGQVRVEDLNSEEAQYIFQGADGTPFHYSPFVSGRCVIIVVGPIRSGKSFTKNTLASHFVKYGGIYRAIDIDQGSETLANFFGNDGAIFKIGTENRGFNPFFYFISPEHLRMPAFMIDALKAKKIRFEECREVESTICKLDVMYVTRIQRERFADQEEYEKLKNSYIITREMLKDVKDNFKVFHPLPRVKEISTDVDTTKYAYYFQQAKNGVYMRQAILSMLLGGI